MQVSSQIAGYCIGVIFMGTNSAKQTLSFMKSLIDEREFVTKSHVAISQLVQYGGIHDGKL